MRREQAAAVAWGLGIQVAVLTVAGVALGGVVAVTAVASAYRRELAVGVRAFLDEAAGVAASRRR